MSHAEPLVGPLEYYSQPGIMTDPGTYGPHLDGLPSDIDSLCRLVQGLMLHVFWAERYGEVLSEERKRETQIRPVSEKIRRILELEDKPLVKARSPARRLVGNCRDFSVLLCAILQHQGVPSRARCGFGVYFVPGRYEDHWVCEYWKADERRWVMLDSQLDEVQRAVLRIDFDPLDVPGDRFLSGGKAWLMCRQGQADPDHFGIFDMHGMWFIQGDLVRDLLALNKVEILPWDVWALMADEKQDVPPEDVALLDQIAGLTLAGNEAFGEVRAIYENEPRLRPPPDWRP